MGRYILEGLGSVGGYGGGLGSDASSDALKIAKLKAQASGFVDANGATHPPDPSAATAVQLATATASTRAAWDKSADAMRKAAAPQIAKLPTAPLNLKAQALASLEKQIVATLGPRPQVPAVPVLTPVTVGPKFTGQGSGGSSGSGDSKEGLSTTTLLVIGAVVVGGGFLLSRR